MFARSCWLCVNLCLWNRGGVTVATSGWEANAPLGQST